MSDTGCVRPENEDRILMDDELALFALADGMGGHQFGEIAAELALATLHRYIEASRDGLNVTWPFGYNVHLSLNGNRLATAIQLANRQVWQTSEDTPEYSGMGTTIAAVLATGDRATIASVGDSRVYLYRNAALEPLTIDDTWVVAMMREGSLNSLEAAHHPLRNVLTQAAGARERIEVHLREHSFRDGDLLMLSTDGLHGVIDESSIGEILGSATNSPVKLDQAAALLLEAALALGAPDNVSCILLHYSDAPG
jgi:serine/threonine protein phosphatase PrpC